MNLTINCYWIFVDIFTIKYTQKKILVLFCFSVSLYANNLNSGDNVRKKGMVGDRGQLEGEGVE